MILLVAQDSDFTRAWAQRLAAAGHRTVAVHAAEQAVVEAERLRPEVVLVDADIGDRAASELLARIGSAQPTIMLLNRSSLDDVLAAVDAIDPPVVARRRARP